MAEKRACRATHSYRVAQKKTGHLLLCVSKVPDISQVSVATWDFITNLLPGLVNRDERILKISQHLRKLQARVWWLLSNHWWFLFNLLDTFLGTYLETYSYAVFGVVLA